MKLVYICLGIILFVSFITYIIGTILERRKKKIIDEMNKYLESIENNE